MRENKFNQVQKGGLDVTKGEIGRPWVLAYFGTDVDWGEGTIRVNVDGVKGIGMERSDKKQCLSLLKINLPGDSVEEVGVNKFFLRVPDVAALLVNNRVLVRVVVVGSKARWGSEEVGKGKEIGS